MQLSFFDPGNRQDQLSKLKDPLVELNRVIDWRCPINLKTSVEWNLEYVDFYFRQGVMRRNNALLQRIATQPELKSGVL
ncbi:MAG: hypothetical protein Q8K59_11500 [Nitrosomonas sp.]|nr:hypothetical protein [Nitrosomonas sp.]MDP1951692.1 hypothetical protein [Nitrosomonas sp.]